MYGGGNEKDISMAGVQMHDIYNPIFPLLFIFLQKSKTLSIAIEYYAYICMSEKFCPFFIVYSLHTKKLKILVGHMVCIYHSILCLILKRKIIRYLNPE